MNLQKKMVIKIVKINDRQGIPPRKKGAPQIKVLSIHHWRVFKERIYSVEMYNLVLKTRIRRDEKPFSSYCGSAACGLISSFNNTSR
jgi:hypothetical protein